MSAQADKFGSRPSDPNADQMLDPYARGSKPGRHPKLAVTWESKAIARDIAPHLLSLTYIDSLSGEADDLAFDVENKGGLWSKDWRPAFGDKVVARLDYDGWFGTNPVTSLRLGTFSHDKLSLSGPPLVAKLQCVSAALSTGLRRAKHTHAWRGVTLKQIASDIAQKASLDLDFSGAPGPAYKSANQNDKSNLQFLQDLCKEVGRTIKVAEGKIVIYDEKTLDATPSSGAIDITGGHVLGFSFDNADGERYGSCHVSCFDPRSGKTVKGQFPKDGQTVAGLDPNGQTLELVIQMSDAGEAGTRAEKALRRANSFALTGEITTQGDCGLVAGVTFDLKNAFGLDGKFIVTRAEHTPIGGYTTKLAARRCLEGY